MTVSPMSSRRGYFPTNLPKVLMTHLRFYEQGYKDGYEHGQLHGLFEGRELGREKGWEILEEVGFYEGWAEFHLAALGRKGVVPGGRGRESR